MSNENQQIIEDGTRLILPLVNIIIEYISEEEWYRMHNFEKIFQDGYVCVRTTQLAKMDMRQDCGQALDIWLRLLLTTPPTNVQVNINHSDGKEQKTWLQPVHRARLNLNGQVLGYERVFAWPRQFQGWFPQSQVHRVENHLKWKETAKKIAEHYMMSPDAIIESITTYVRSRPGNHIIQLELSMDHKPFASYRPRHILFNQETNPDSYWFSQYNPSWEFVDYFSDASTGTFIRTIFFQFVACK